MADTETAADVLTEKQLVLRMTRAQRQELDAKISAAERQALESCRLPPPQIANWGFIKTRAWRVTQKRLVAFCTRDEPRPKYANRLQTIAALSATLAAVDTMTVEQCQTLISGSQEIGNED